MTVLIVGMLDMCDFMRQFHQLIKMYVFLRTDKMFKDFKHMIIGLNAEESAGFNV